MTYRLRDLGRSFILVFVPLAIAAAAYWPGLTGTFLFDDFPNLSVLGNITDTDISNRIAIFTLTGDAGPTGRPVSLLSFMINDTAWPTNAWSFKYTNLMIHLLNGTLVFLLVYTLFRIAGIPEARACWIAFFSSLLWLIHPLQTSTVLYVIQRMTELSALFSLAALICYIYGRKWIDSSPKAAYAMMTSGLVLFGTLSVFSKENGVLLLLYIVTIELALLRPMGLKPPRGFKYWMMAFVYAPITILALYFVITFDTRIAGYALRPFTLGERLLTESRILIDYLYQIIFPRLGGTGLFHEDYPISHSLVSPPWTLAAVTGMLLIVASGFMARKRFPVYSFSVFWFLSGHVLESTFLPLELYFEHRNYLALLGPMAGLTYAALTAAGKLQKLSTLLLSVLTLTFSFITWSNATVWGNPAIAAPIWATENPTSIRAQQHASAISVQLGDLKKARKYLADAMTIHPRESVLILQVFMLDCQIKPVDEARIEKVITELPGSKYSHATLDTLITLSNFSMQGNCGILNNEAMRKVFDILIENENFQTPATLHMLYYWLGKLYADALQLPPAIEALDRANEYQGVVDIPLLQAVWLSSAGLYDDALAYVDKARHMEERVKTPFLKGIRKDDIDGLERLIKTAQENDESHSSANGPRITPLGVKPALRYDSTQPD